jgi:hypothetical protein
LELHTQLLLVRVVQVVLAQTQVLLETTRFFLLLLLTAVVVAAVLLTLVAVVVRAVAVLQELPQTRQVHQVKVMLVDKVVLHQVVAVAVRAEMVRMALEEMVETVVQEPQIV